MAKKPKLGDQIAMGRIEHGEIVDGKNVVRTFEPGDVVDLGPKVLEGLSACGAVNPFEMSAEARVRAAADARAEAETKAKLQDEARTNWAATPDMQKQFPQVEAYLASLDLA
ncbi:hypothetical protein ACNJYD_19855 [Bradyrhizobium sp. DASA03005]|uniref:hypothetical protein n=1 Tax=Bradyrhizobium sp. SPXBL-02 TaxID=3395912 RepID=UPI003F72D465